MVVLLHREGAREAHARGDLYVVVGQVLAVATTTVGLDKEGLGEVVGTDLLEHVVLDALGIAEVLFGKLAIVAFDAQAEGHVGVDHRLTAHGLAIPIVGNANRGKDLKIGAPLDSGAGAVLVTGLNLECLLLGADNLTLLKVQRVLVAIAPNRDVHVFGGVLGRAGAQAVGAEREVVVATLVVVVFAAGVELAKDEFPVKALLGGVPIERAAAAVILYLDRAIAKSSEGDELAVALARFVNGVGQDLEGGMRATVESVRAKDDGRAQAYALLVLELADTVVTIVCGVFCHTRSLGAPLLRFSHIDSQGSIAQPIGDSNQHEIHRTIVRNLVEQRLLGQNRLGSVRVSLKAAECVLLRLRLDTLSKTCRADCWIESNIGTSVSFYGPRACVCESLWPIRNAVGSLFGPRVTLPAPCFVIRS